MTTTREIQPWRQLAGIVQALVIIGLPFIRTGGESLLRFDVPTLQFHFFGLSLWMDEFFIVLIALIFVAFLILFITLVLGRVWCGWVCPQTVIADFTSFVEKVKNREFYHKLIACSATFMISLVVAANLIWYFVSPYEFIPRLIEGSLGKVVWSFWGIMTGILFLNFILLRQKFCATVCPYARLQSTLFDDRTLTVAFDPRRKDECIDCMACVKTCPVGIDIRDGMNGACIHCAQCVDKCAKVMEGRERKSLVGYFFGLPGQGGRLVRQNAVLLGSVTAAFLVFFMYLLITRPPVEIMIFSDYREIPRLNAKGELSNSFVLTVKNRGREDMDFVVKAGGENMTAEIIQDKILHIKAGEMKRYPVSIKIRGLDRGQPGHEIMITVEPLRGGGGMLTEKAYLIVPEDS